MHMTIRHAQALEGVDARVHKRPRTTYKGLGEQKRPRQFGQLLNAGDALYRVQPVNDLQALRISAGQGLELILENHRGFVAVGIKQENAARTGKQGRTQDRQHRRYPAAAAEQQQVAVEVARHKNPRRWQHVNRLTDL